jgi:hypothetical protein
MADELDPNLDLGLRYTGGINAPKKGEEAFHAVVNPDGDNLIYLEQNKALELTLVESSITIPDAKATGRRWRVKVIAPDSTPEAMYSLYTFNGGRDGDVIYLQIADEAHPIVVATDGNTVLATGDFHLLSFRHVLTLMRVGSTWREVCRTVFAADGSDLSSNDIPWDGTTIPGSPGTVTAATEAAYANSLHIDGSNAMAADLPMAGHRIANQGFYQDSYVLGGDVNDLTLSGFAALEHLDVTNGSPTVLRRVTGFDATSITTKRKLVTHTGEMVANAAIVIGHLDEGSAEENRVICPCGVDLVVQPGESLWLVRDETAVRWRAISCGASGATVSRQASDPKLKIKLLPEYVWRDQFAEAAGDPLVFTTDTIPEDSVLEMGFSVDGIDTDRNRYFRRGMVTFCRDGAGALAWLTSDGNPLITDSPAQWGAIIGASTDVQIDGNTVQFTINPGTLLDSNWNLRVWQIQGGTPTD